MVDLFSATARRLGIWSAAAFIVLGVVYAITLVIGLVSLKSPKDPIADPMFSILEVLIIVMMPALVALIVAVHAWASPQAKSLTLVAVIFMGLVAAVTCMIHFVILTLSHQQAFEGQAWMRLTFEFRWPSVIYALDILAWDVFFPISVLFAAPALSRSRLAKWTRALMIVSGVLAFAGLSGVLANNMQLRNIGIVGYLPVFLVVAWLLAVLFARTPPSIDGSRLESGAGL